ncbi:MAG: hypothetical protein Kow0042_01820 [Calditrichia bacterium]
MGMVVVVTGVGAPVPPAMLVVVVMPAMFAGLFRFVLRMVMTGMFGMRISFIPAVLMMMRVPLMRTRFFRFFVMM